MKKAIKLMLVSVVAVAVLAGCAAPPTEETAAARTAMDSVMSDGAEKYTPEDMQQISKKMEEALAEIKTQEAKTFSNYDNAKAMLAQVVSESTSLKTKVAQRKEELKAAANTALTDAQAMVAEAKAILEVAPKGKGSLADIEAMKTDVAGLEAELQGVPAQIESGEFVAAAEKAQAVSSRAMAITGEVRAVQEKLAAAKK